MKRFIMTRGLPGSGKSTWAKELAKNDTSFVRINNDELRLMMFNRQFDREDSSFIRTARHAIVQAAISQCKSIIIDNVNLDNKLIKGGRKIAESNDYEFEVVEFNSPLNVCIERDLLRVGKGGYVTDKVIRNMFNTFLYPTKVCRGCGQKASNGIEYEIEPYDRTSPQECSVCGKLNYLSPVVNFGTPKF